MFNNRFNSSKNDPLVEAVKTARADGDARRLAESMANDLFGVYSRKAVVREHLSDYDYALEEAYKCVKEEDKMADKDYDGDGKIETSKKEVWGSRLRAAKASGKYKGPVDEKKDCYEESDGLPPSDAAKQAGAAQQSQTPSSTPKRTGNAAGSTISNARAATGMQEAQLDELKKPTAKTAMKALGRAERSDDESDSDYKRSNRLYRWKQKNLPGKSARNQKDTGKAELPSTGNVEFHKAGYSGHVTKSGKLTKSATKDTKTDIKSRLGKHTKPKHLPEEQIDEATRKHFAAHAADIAKISDQSERNKAASSAASTYARLNPRFDHAKFHKAAGSTAHETQTMKESIIAKLFAEQGF